MTSETEQPPTDPSPSTGSGPGAGAPSGRRGVELEPLVTAADLEELHREVLSPSFPPEELESVESLVDGCTQGRTRALGVRRGGRVVAGAVAAGSGTPGDVMLLVYLAIAPGQRGGGIGGALLDAAVQRWVAESSPGLLVAEVEHPDHHEASEAHGDPAARLRFYARHGARVLAVPYFQPGLGAAGARVPALMLCTLHEAPEAVVEGPADAPTAVDAGPLRDFLTSYLVGSEGSLRDDADTRALLDSVSGPSVGLVDPVDPVDLAGVPVGMAWATEAAAAQDGDEA